MSERDLDIDTAGAKPSKRRAVRDGIFVNQSRSRKALKSPISQSTLRENVQVYLVVMGEKSVSSCPPSLPPSII